MRHDEIRDTFAKIMKDVCFDIEVEPKLQRLEGESFEYKSTCTEDEARLDIGANGFWDSRERILTSKFLTRWPSPVRKK